VALVAREKVALVARATKGARKRVVLAKETKRAREGGDDDLTGRGGIVEQ
jgi:hypothetical protein